MLSSVMSPNVIFRPHDVEASPISRSSPFRIPCKQTSTTREFSIANGYTVLRSSWRSLAGGRAARRSGGPVVRVGAIVHFKTAIPPHFVANASLVSRYTLNKTCEGTSDERRATSDERQRANIRHVPARISGADLMGGRLTQDEQHGGG